MLLFDLWQRLLYYDETKLCTVDEDKSQFPGVWVGAVYCSGKSKSLKPLKHLTDWKVNLLRRSKTVNCNSLWNTECLFAWLSEKKKIINCPNVLIDQLPWSIYGAPVQSSKRDIAAHASCMIWTWAKADKLQSEGCWTSSDFHEGNQRSVWSISWNSLWCTLNDKRKLKRDIVM